MSVWKLRVMFQEFVERGKDVGPQLPPPWTWLLRLKNLRGHSRSPLPQRGTDQLFGKLGILFVKPFLDGTFGQLDDLVGILQRLNSQLQLGRLIQVFLTRILRL